MAHLRSSKRCRTLFILTMHFCYSSPSSWSGSTGLLCDMLGWVGYRKWMRAYPVPAAVSSSFSISLMETMVTLERSSFLLLFVLDQKQFNLQLVVGSGTVADVGATAQGSRGIDGVGGGGGSAHALTQSRTRALVWLYTYSYTMFCCHTQPVPRYCV